MGMSSVHDVCVMGGVVLQSECICCRVIVGMTRLSKSDHVVGCSRAYHLLYVG